MQETQTQHQQAEERYAFRTDGRRLGCVLVHGLTSTPECMRELGREFSDAGIDVDAVLLPGHGTRAEDLLDVSWRDWEATVDDAIARLRERCDRVFILGQSLGGALALHSAAGGKVDGVMTLAAIAFLKNWRLWFVPVIKPLMRWRPSAGNDIARDVVDEGSYDRMPMHAIQQLLQVSSRVRKELPNIKVPALIMQSTVDHVVPVSNADYIYKRIGSEQKTLVRLYNSYHVISLDNDRQLVATRCVKFMRAVGFAKTNGTSP